MAKKNIAKAKVQIRKVKARAKVELGRHMRALKLAAKRYKLALKDPPYNYVIHSAPPGAQHPERYHWQVELLPKLTEVAGER